MPPLLVEYADYIEGETEEKYNESDDDDFNPEDAPAEEASSSSDEDATTAVPEPRKGKRKAPADEELDSGDEVTIKAARKRKSKKQKKGKKDDDDDVILSDGEGGLIKTRAQRREEKVERRPLARTDGATVDVDALWAQMTAAPLAPITVEVGKPSEPTPAFPTKPPAEEEDLIPISKTFSFAGQDTTEQKSIPRSHLEKYTADGWTLSSTTNPPTLTASLDRPKANTSRTRRPLRRPSRFDPNPSAFVRALAPEYQLSWPRTTTLARAHEMPPPEPTNKGKEKATKLNVVDKSRMDWTGFVETEGIAEELDTHGKTKEAYLGRMEFLAGVEARREEGRLNLKAKGGGVSAGGGGGSAV